MYLYCGNDCEMDQNERVTRRIEADSGVSKRRALQILSEEDESPLQTLFHTLQISDAK